MIVKTVQNNGLNETNLKAWGPESESMNWVWVYEPSLATISL